MPISLQNNNYSAESRNFSVQNFYEMLLTKFERKFRETISVLLSAYPSRRLIKPKYPQGKYFSSAEITLQFEWLRGMELTGRLVSWSILFYWERIFVCCCYDFLGTFMESSMESCARSWMWRFMFFCSQIILLTAINNFTSNLITKHHHTHQNFKLLFDWPFTQKIPRVYAPHKQPPSLWWLQIPHTFLQFCKLLRCMWYTEPSALPKANSKLTNLLENDLLANFCLHAPPNPRAYPANSLSDLPEICQN